MPLIFDRFWPFLAIGKKKIVKKNTERFNELKVIFLQLVP